MKLTKSGFVLFVLIAGLLFACGSQPANAPASPPASDTPFAAESPTLPATETVIPTVAPSFTEAPTETPTTEPAPAAEVVGFTSDILPLLESRCLNCHGGERVEEGLVMKTHADLMAGSNNGPVVIPGDAANSLMAQLLLNNKMPKRGPKLTPPQVQLIIDWINQGALEN